MSSPQEVNSLWSQWIKTFTKQYQTFHNTTCTPLPFTSRGSQTKDFKTLIELLNLKAYIKIFRVVGFKLTMYVTQRRRGEVCVACWNDKCPHAGYSSGCKVAQLHDSWSAVPVGNTPHLCYQHETLNKHLKTSTQLPAKTAELTGGYGNFVRVRHRVRYLGRW